jgi:predicted RecA/RadA family phage recombinase
MATNVIYNQGDHLSWPVAADTASGVFVIIGDQGLYGVTMTAEGEGGNPDGYASIQHSGVFDLPVSTTTVASIGDKVYMVPATGVLTPVSTDNVHVGWFYAAKGATANAAVAVRLAQV